MSETRPQTASEMIEHIRSIDVPAPETLHREVQALVSERTRASDRTGISGRARTGASARAGVPRRLPALALTLGVLASVAVAVVAVIAFSGGGGITHNGVTRNGGPQTPDLRQAANLTLRPATLAAPEQSTTNRAQLTAAVEGVSFPYWDTPSLGWHATGARHDRIGGQAVTTVFYGNGRGQRIGYAILAGSPPAPAISGGTVAWRGHTPYRLSAVGGVPVVTWLRDGHLCVLSGRGVHSATLLTLASWGEPASAA